jgi:2-iminobutanoate/2-iminopropanoate deaminase
VVVGDLVFVAGQVPKDPQTGLIPESIEDQTHLVFKNIKAILEAAGSDLSQVVRVDVYLTTLDNFHRMNEVYKTYFDENYPVRTTVGVELRGFDIEITVIAHKAA